MVVVVSLRVVGRVLLDLLPWLCTWQGLYWLSYAASPLLCNKTVPRLDRDAGEKGYWCSSVVSTIFAIVITPASAAALAAEPFLLDPHAFSVTTPLSRLLCSVFLGYLLSDSLISLCYNRRWPGWKANLAHHLTICTAWLVLLIGGWGQGLALLGQVMEATTPFINLRWFLDKAGRKEGTLYFVNGCLMLGLWFFFRILGSLLMVYCTFRQIEDGASTQEVPWWILVFLGCTGAMIISLQFYWFSKIVRGAIKVLRKASASKRTAPSKSSATAADKAKAKLDDSVDEP